MFSVSTRKNRDRWRGRAARTKSRGWWMRTSVAIRLCITTTTSSSSSCFPSTPKSVLSRVTRHVRGHGRDTPQVCVCVSVWAWREGNGDSKTVFLPNRLPPGPLSVVNHRGGRRSGRPVESPPFRYQIMVSDPVPWADPNVILQSFLWSQTKKKVQTTWADVKRRSTNGEHWFRFRHTNCGRRTITTTIRKTLNVERFESDVWLAHFSSKKSQRVSKLRVETIVTTTR